MTLKSEIASWNKRSHDEIEDIYQRFGESKDFSLQLAEMIGDPELQLGATWLLKHHLEQLKFKVGQKVEPKVADLIFESIHGFCHWESRLHILQIMDHLPIAKDKLKAVEYFVRECLVAENKFVRAWGFTGFCQIAEQYPDYKLEAKQLLQYALENETAGSVKARVRAELKKNFI